MFGVAAAVTPLYPNSFHWSTPMSSITIKRMFGTGVCAACTDPQTSTTPASAINDASVTRVRCLNGSDESIGARCLPFTNVGVLLGRTIYVSSCGEIGPCAYCSRWTETSLPVYSARGSRCSPRTFGGRAFFLRRALARLLGLALLFLSGELDHRHHRRVAAAMTELDHARIAAIAILEARRDLVEQLLDRIVRLQGRERAPARGEIVLLAERDHPVRDSPQLLGLGIGRFDSLVTNQREHHVLEQRLTMRRGAIELAARIKMTHQLLQTLTERSNADSRRTLCRLAAFLLFPHAVELAARRQVLEAHPEREAHVGQDFLDLVEGLASEVFNFEHVLLGALHQLANILDVGVLQTVEGAHRNRQAFDRAIEQLAHRGSRVAVV